MTASGVIDWGRVYATVPFPVKGNRSVLVGWTYVSTSSSLELSLSLTLSSKEDDETLALAAQRGYQGSFTLFRDLYTKVIRNVDPNTPGLYGAGSWTVRNETDGSVSVVTLGQKIVPEITTEYRRKSTVLSPKDSTFSGPEGYVAFDTQPTGRHYAIQATLKWTHNDTGEMPVAGFRVLASDQEWTDIYFDPSNETLYVNRTKNSLIASCSLHPSILTCRHDLQIAYIDGTETEAGKLRLWPILTNDSSTRQPLNLTIIVDNSVVEVYANDVTVITTRAYPWLAASKGAGFYVQSPSYGAGKGRVQYSGVELWDGLINAWPDRPANTTKSLLWDGPLPNIWGLWTGF